MKQRLLIYASCAVLGLAAAAPSLGQSDPSKFGKIDPKDMDKATFAADTAANAIILSDFGRSHFDIGAKGSFRVVFERVTRIKILKKGGYEWGTVEIPLYRKNSEEEKVTGLKGFTYNVGPNGEITKDKLEDKAMFTEKVDANHMLRKFTMPNVREGSVIEYAYTVSSDFLFNFQDWQFQHSIPVRWSEYRANIPEYFDYKQLAQGYEPFVVNERNMGLGQFTVRWSSEITPGMDGGRTSGGSQTVSAKVTNYRWAMQNVPALRPEPYMTTPRDYVARIDFELAGVQWPQEAYRDVSGTWEKMQEELLTHENFGKQLERSSFLKDQITALAAKYPNPADRAAAVHELVSTTVKSNGYSLLASAPGRKTWEQRSGNSADVNLLLISLLRTAGLKANPVILSTRQHGRVDSNFPLLSRFNYVVAHVQLNDSMQVLADATEPLAPFGMLPENCLNGQGRLIQGNNAGAWVPLASSHRYVHFRSANLTLDERGNLSGKVRDEHGGYLGVQERNELREKGEKKYMEALLKEQDNWKVDRFAFQNTTALNKSLLLEMDVRVPGESEEPLGTIYLNVLSSLTEATNPFRLTDRRFPVDFGARREETNMVTLTLPANYVVEEAPKNTIVEMPNGGGRFVFSVTPVGNNLQIMSRMMLNRPMYLADEYAGLREFYERMVAKQAEKIVIKRKS